MKRITKKQWEDKHPDFKGIWTTERWDLPNWAEIRDKHIGKKTIMDNENGATVLLVEGIHFEIVD